MDERIPPPKIDLSASRMRGHSAESAGKAARNPFKSARMGSSKTGPGSPGSVAARRNTSFRCLSMSLPSSFSPRSLRLLRFCGKETEGVLLWRTSQSGIPAKWHRGESRLSIREAMGNRIFASALRLSFLLDFKLLLCSIFSTLQIKWHHFLRSKTRPARDSLSRMRLLRCLRPTFYPESLGLARARVNCNPSNVR